MKSIGTSTFNNHKALLFCLSSAFAVLLALLLSKNASDSYDTHIAVLIPGPVPFFDIQTKAMDSAAKLNNIKITYFNANWDPFIQIQQLKNVLTLKVDAIALASVDNQALKVAPALVKKYHIPLVTFTNAIGTDRYGKYPGVAAHVGRDEIEAGQLLAQQIELLRQNQPTKIMLVQGAAGTTPQQLREQGFLEILSNHPNWTLEKNVIIAQWDSEIVENEVQKLYQSDQLVDVIATQWSQASLAASYVNKKNANKMSIVGLEFSEAIKKEIIKGNISSTSNFSIAEEGQVAIMTIADILKKKETNFFSSIKQTIVNSSNVTNIIPEY